MNAASKGKTEAWVFDEVPTSCGRCFRIGTQAEIDQKKHADAPRLPSYACLYDDNGHGENATKAKARLIINAVNSHADLLKALESAQRIIERDFPNGQLVIDIRAAIAKARTSS